MGRRNSSRSDVPAADNRFAPELAYAAAMLYYNRDATQAQIAEQLGTSRPTVSRLLAEARRSGIVRIEVIPPGNDAALARTVARRLDLAAVHVEPFAPDAVVGSALTPGLVAVLRGAQLRAGDVILVSSGRTMHQAAQQTLLPIPDTLIAPTVGGQDEPEAWYQTNEITRLLAERVGGHPRFLYAPALPSPDLHERLVRDPSVTRVTELWAQASCAILGIGAPPHARRSLPNFARAAGPWLRDAVGDICTRFYDAEGVPLAFPGSEHLIATDLETLRRIPLTVAMAAGRAKVPSIIAGARGRWFDHLVTDAPTAAALIEATDGQDDRVHHGA